MRATYALRFRLTPRLPSLFSWLTGNRAQALPVERPGRLVEQLVDREAARNDFLLERILDDELERPAQRGYAERMEVDAARMRRRRLLAALEHAINLLHHVGPGAR